MIDLEGELRALRNDDRHAHDVAISRQVEQRIATRSRVRNAVTIVFAGALAAVAGWVSGRWTASGLANLAGVHSAEAVQAITAALSSLVCVMAAFALSAIVAARRGDR